MPRKTKAEIELEEAAATEVAILENINAEPITTTISVIVPEVDVQDAAVDLDELQDIDMRASTLYPPIPAGKHVINNYGNQLVARPKKEYASRLLPILATGMAALAFAIGLVAIGVIIGQTYST